MDSIFIFFRQDLQDYWDFFRGEMPSAEGRFILTILFILSNYFSKIRIHSFSFSIKLAALPRRVNFSGQRQCWTPTP